MRRTLLAALVGLVCLLPVDGESGRDVRTSIVTCTTARLHLVAAYPNRQDLVAQNVGSLHVNVGRGTVMTTLHVGSSLSLENYQGGLECQTQAGTGSTQVEILEVDK